MRAKLLIKLLGTFLIGIFFIPNICFSGDKTNVFFTIEKEVAVSPDLLLFSITVQASGKTEKEVINSLGKADQRIKSLKIKYHGGRYNVRQDCYWKKGEYICKGFIGSANYVFEINSQKEEVKILETLEKTPKTYKYFVNSQHWTVSDEKKKEIENNLFSSIFDDIFARKKLIEGKLQGKCSIKEIRFEERGAPIVRKSFLTRALGAEEGIKPPFPEKEKIRFSKRVRVILSCSSNL